MTTIEYKTTKTISTHHFKGFVLIQYKGYDYRDMVVKKAAFTKKFGKSPKVEDLENACSLLSTGKHTNAGFFMSPVELAYYKANPYGTYPKPGVKGWTISSEEALALIESGDTSGVVFGAQYDGLVYDVNGDPIPRPIVFDAGSYAFKDLSVLAEKLSKNPRVSEAEYYPAHCSDCGSGVKFTANLTVEEISSLLKDGTFSSSPYNKEMRALFPPLEEHYSTEENDTNSDNDYDY